MSENKMRVLHIGFGDTYNGVYEIIRRFERNMTNTEFDYLSPVKVYDFLNAFDLNINIKSFKNRIIYNYLLYKFLKKHKYDIVHINGGRFFLSLSCAIICNLLKVKTIVHSHSCLTMKNRKKILMKILNPLYRKITNVHLTCSMPAAKALFTKFDDVIIIKNGLETSDYRYNENTRNKYRKELNIENKTVYGNVAAFNKNKNQNFLVDLFYQIQKKRQDAVLLLIGTGETEEIIKEKVKELNIENKVFFLGFRNDIDRLLNAMDIFIFPSISEGLGNVVIEALTSGLPTFVSNGIPDETNISSNFHKINTFNINEWASEILRIKTPDRTNAYKDTIKAGFDIKDSARELEHIYTNLMK